ncbi:hypothetical protein JHL18_04055 [Clostridium sp. YIM B02505]|uniref:Dockerin domain-containing protein n=1 Tax=Clostridium yunnanense TaxID=2800325 RepID=A0ABS1EKD0_9CLOT|nr:dockerin type I domain-containing protein [Clostridium yunnanense]MBK1809814.1 hypothetical protein [Clostridium yunnanense]
MSNKFKNFKYSSNIKRSILISCSILAATSTLYMTEVKAEQIIPKKSVAIAQDISWMKPNTSVVGSSITIDLAQHFNMLNSGNLVISAISSDNKIINPTVSSNILTLDIKAIGVAIITVTASDSKTTLVDKFEVKANKLGDINSDGLINTADALLIYKVTSGKVTPTDEDIKRMDLNEDGKVTNADADIIMNTYVGKPNAGIFANSTIEVRNINDAPVASQVYLEGNAISGQTLTGKYSFIDVDNDTEGSTVFKWYRGAKADGSDKVLINGANSNQYTLTDEDGDKYIFFEVDPVAASGNMNGKAVVSLPSGKVIVPDVTAPSLNISKFNFVDNESPKEDTLSGLAGAVSEGNAIIKAYLCIDANSDNKVDETELPTPIVLGNSSQDGSVAAKNIGDLAPGKYKYVITATDAFGNESSKNQAAVINVAVRELKLNVANRNPLEENNINDAIVTLKLTGDSFRNTITTSDLLLNNLPTGASVKNVSFVDKSTVNITLAFDGTDFDSGITNFNIEVKASGLDSSKNISTKNLTINNSNDAPIASNVSIVGDAKVGKLITGSYSFKDDENDVEGVSIYKWYRASQADGSDKVAIDGATSKQYQIKPEDDSKYLFFEVAPVAVSGETTGKVVLSAASDKVVTPDTTAPILDVNKFNFIDNQSPSEDMIVGLLGSVGEGGATIKAYPWVDTNNDGKVSADELQSAIVLGVSGMDGSVLAKSIGDLAPDKYSYVITATDIAGNESAKNENSVLKFAIRDLNVKLSNVSELTEDNINGAVLTLELKGDSFKNTITKTDLNLNNAPAGVGIKSVSLNGENNLSVVLEYNGTDFDTDINNFVLEVNSTALESGQTISAQAITIKRSNDAPTAGEVKITGTAKLGETLSGEYIYSDDENDVEGTSTYKWYRATKADGSDKVLISGAEAKQYTLVAEDGEKYIFFEVTPIATSGKVSGNVEVSAASSKVIVPDLIAPTLDISKFSFVNNDALTEDTIGALAGAVSEEGATIKAYLWNDTNGDSKVDIDELQSPIILGVSGQDGSVLAKNIGDLADGKYKYVITATDAAGNESAKNEAAVMDISTKAFIANFFDVSELREDNINGATLEMKLQGDAYKDTISPMDFTLNNAPAGVEVAMVLPMDEHSVFLVLGADGNDFDVDYNNFSITLNSSGTVSGEEATTKTMNIKSVVEGLALEVAGINFGPGDLVDTTKTALPIGGFKYVIGGAGQYTRPNKNDSAAAYTNILQSTTNIPVTSGQHLYVVGIDGNNRVISWSDITVTEAIIKQRAQTAGVFISEYLQGPNNRLAIQLYNNTGTQLGSPSGYSLEVHQWNPVTKAKRVLNMPIDGAQPNMVFIILESNFYDFFDITSAWYYNDEMYFGGLVNNALVLKKNGQIVDVLGDPNFVGSKPIVADGNVVVRKKGIIGGYNVYYSKEWDIYNQSTQNIYQYMGVHSIQ